MKIRYFNIFGLKTFASAILISSIGSMMSYAAQPAEDPFELNFEDNLTTPALPSKSAQAIKDNVEKLRTTFSRYGFNTKLVRNGEVILITIPCSELFAANESTVSPTGQKILNKFVIPAEYRGKYKVLIAVHSDDTGEQMYVDDLTAARSNAIDDMLAAGFNNLEIISVPYGIGRDEPIKPNDSVANRAANRRVEIYIVPLL